VWAAGGPDPAMITHRHGAWHLNGQKPWCSGATIVTHALVVAQRGDAETLVLVDLSAPGITIHAPTWQPEAFANTDTRTVSFDLSLADYQIIGPDNWYGSRPGFWHGATGVAAAWAGSAQCLIQHLLPEWRNDAHSLAHLGAIDADMSAMRMVLRSAGDEIDSLADQGDEGRRRALRVRHLVDTTVADITTRTFRALGPAPFVYQEDVHRILTEIDLYRRQCHAERDLEQLGRLVDR
jgi:alkylation response protein AidB-like acyl-CoA dehydrogenase